ncbi:acetylornithine deacetylase [Telmatospirillum sp. J64-1]|uniref:acetylornithine deacetylase n=1 Tax=Telmatospirillum sp. J64-1 TaxID=2502183 RepID=UPI00115ECA8D|nr:acetylornithine deacetylase [Telmatospirillum sp. J64-1]
MNTIDLLRRLIAFDTTSSNSNQALIDFATEYLSGFGAVCSFSHSDDGRKSNLLATIGPQDRPGFVFSGHTDVVPVAGQAWTSDPFEMVERDGLLYGRGTADMKGFIAAVLAAVPQMAEQGSERPFHIALSYDEELGCLGAPRLIEQIASLPYRPLGCLIGEPTGMKAVTAHKGKSAVRCHVHGKECHSALPQNGVNAVEYAARLIVHAADLGRRQRESGRQDQRFMPPYTTLHTGVVTGGTALNIVPRDCSFDLEVRAIPGDDAASFIEQVKDYAETVLLPEMRLQAEQAGIRWEGLSSYPALDMDDDHPLTRLICQLGGDNATATVSFGTEGGLYQAAEVPTIVCGPGSIEQAHKPDEYIAREQLARCDDFLSRLIRQVRTGRLDWGEL